MSLKYIHGIKLESLELYFIFDLLKDFLKNYEKR